MSFQMSVHETQLEKDTTACNLPRSFLKIRERSKKSVIYDERQVEENRDRETMRTRPIARVHALRAAFFVLHTEYMWFVHACVVLFNI